jgi:hypothetical protein
MKKRGYRKYNLLQASESNCKPKECVWCLKFSTAGLSSSLSPSGCVFEIEIYKP